ncbi:hypothetical protein [Oribacterium sp. NK2B42]|uniref:hypothetical protein n=1 Tax=Oribacterium sp. NK2B42 TaxID=689781 RepID=UPI00041C3754|nr:hypothetical protein [Oribacterium sp. NK2B42]
MMQLQIDQSNYDWSACKKIFDALKNVHPSAFYCPYDAHYVTEHLDSAFFTKST